MKIPLALIAISIACYSCSSTNLMSLSVTQPAPVGLPPTAKSIAVVNRTRASDENKVIDALHKITSLETKELQTEGAKASVTGLVDELMKNDRFTSVKYLDKLDLRSFGAGVFPSSLSWDTVDRICRDNRSDLLFSLELFDAQSRVDAAPNGLNKVVGDLAVLQQKVSMTTLVKTGWRIYDPVSRTILDEYVLSKDLVSSSRGINVLAAGSAIAGHKEAIKQTGNRAGQAYASRILPYSIRVSRYYYVRGDGNFVIAKRMAQTGNWDGAAKLWQQETNSPHRKVAGRACYNMAIISEINGDLEGAIQWAQKSYENYNNRLALSYVNVLRDRQADKAVLQSQTETTGAP